MLYRSMVSSVSLVAGLFVGQVAMADVTAQEVWDSMVAAAKMSNETLSGSVSQKGDTLTVSDALIVYDSDEARVEVPLGTLKLEELRDGSVSILSPDTYQMLVKITPDDADTPVEVVLDVTQKDAEIVASGNREALTYTYDVGKLTLELVDLMVEGEDIDMSMTGTLSDLSGSYDITPNGGMSLTKSEMNVKSTDIVMAATAPNDQGDGHLDVRVGILDLTSTSKATMPENADYTDFAKMIAAGMQTEGQMQHGAATLAVDFADKVETGKVNGSISSGKILFSLLGPIMDYSSDYRDLVITASGSQIPLPEVSFGIREYISALKMPVAKTDEPSDFAMVAALRGITVSDMIWGMFDPTGQLPHDPANLVVDLSGQGNWNFDPFDPEQAEDLDGAPGALHALDVNDLELSIAGASLTGAGGFTFDNSDLATFNGLPAPDGTINLKLTGGNTLLDTLVAMGLVPQDQVMGFRMMMGLFARPGEGPDTMESEITVTPEGHVLANGQRLK